MNKKYKLTNETIQIGNKTLYRIQALRDIPGYVNAGDFGGFVESEYNLSHEGTCWVFDDACVYDNAIVTNNAKIYNKAHISERARIMDCSAIYNEAHVAGHAIICGESRIRDNVVVADNAFISNTNLYGNVHIHKRTSLSCCNVRDFVDIGGVMYLYDANFGGEAKIKCLADYYLVQSPNQYGTMLTIYKGIDGNKYVFESSYDRPILFSDFMKQLLSENKKYKSFKRYINNYFSIREKEVYHEPRSFFVKSYHTDNETTFSFSVLDDELER